MWKLLKEHGLPPVGVPIIVTIIDSLRNERALRYPVVYRKDFYADHYGFYMDDCSILLPEYSEVIAWCFIPKPYSGDIES